MMSSYDLCREGFLSKLDSSGFASANSSGPDSSYSDGNKGESESTCTEGGVTINHIAADSEDTTADGIRNNMQELEVQIVEAEEPVLDSEGNREDLPVCATIAGSGGESALATEARPHEVFSHVEREPINTTLANRTLLESTYINCSDSSEVYNENSEPIGGASAVYEVVDHSADLEGNTNEEFDSHDASVQAQEYQHSLSEVEESVEQNINTVAFTEWADGNDIEEPGQMQESHVWPNHGLQEAIDSWLDVPSSEAGESVREGDTDFFQYDDDNVNSMELRELFSRYPI